MKNVSFSTATSGNDDAEKGIMRGRDAARCFSQSTKYPTLGGICNAAVKRRRIYNPTKSISESGKPLFAKRPLNRTVNATITD